MKIVSHIDFDGLISAYLLKLLNPQACEVMFIQHGEVQRYTDKEDVVADLPMPDKYARWYDHHTNCNILALQPDKTFWDTRAKSAARIILTTHIKEFSQRKDFPRIAALVEAADRIDTGMFTSYKNPTPEEIISMTLLTKNNERDYTYKHYLLKLLQNGMTLEQISEDQLVRESLKFKKSVIDAEYKTSQQTTIDRYGIQFIILKNDHKITKSVIYKTFDEHPNTKYVLAQTPHTNNSEQHVILIQASPYKHDNRVHIGKALKHANAKAFNEGTAMFAILKAEVDTKTEEFIEKLATLERTAGEGK